MRPTRMYVFLIIAGLLLATGILMARANPETQGVPIMASSSDTSRFGDYQPISSDLFRKLNPLEAQVILRKGTERAFTGVYTDLEDAGTYYCRQCDSPLYSSEDKFHSGCGWPAFDTELPGAVTRIPDADGMRTEIVCSTCSAHLGHVFLGEGFTDTNTRHCVNSISMVFRSETPKAKAVFAGGCFWGVEYLFEKLPGVYAATSGYTGGQTENPTYREVLTHKTGHLEAVEVEYNPLEISYEDLAKFFFEIHDPTQADGQGPDIGNQYLSAVFYRSRGEYDTALKLIGILENKGYKIATTLRPAAVFWAAEEYHQDYYDLKGTTPYCHSWTKKF